MIFSKSKCSIDDEDYPLFLCIPVHGGKKRREVKRMFVRILEQEEENGDYEKMVHCNLVSNMLHHVKKG